MPNHIPDHPNVLLICTDHWSGLLNRNAGHPVVMTPTLSQLSRLGVTFYRPTPPAPRASRPDAR